MASNVLRPARLAIARNFDRPIWFFCASPCKSLILSPNAYCWHSSQMTKACAEAMVKIRPRGAGDDPAPVSIDQFPFARPVAVWLRIIR